MPATFGGQITLLVGLCALVTFAAKTYGVYKRHAAEERRKHEEDALHREWQEEMLIWWARQTGKRLPKSIVEKHMAINGNRHWPDDRKRKIYGDDYDHDSGEIDPSTIHPRSKGASK